MPARRIVLWAALVLALPALAEEKVVKEPDRILYEKKTVIDFNEKTLEGELAKPQGSYLMERRKTQFDSLLWMRRDFKQELTRSVDDM